MTDDARILWFVAGALCFSAFYQLANMFGLSHILTGTWHCTHWVTSATDVTCGQWTKGAR